MKNSLAAAAHPVHVSFPYAYGFLAEMEAGTWVVTPFAGPALPVEPAHAPDLDSLDIDELLSLCAG